MIKEDYTKEKRFFAYILFNEHGKYQPYEKVYFRNEMTLPFLMKWKWYFKYREAILRVKYPKAYIELRTGPYDYILPKNELQKKLKNNLSAAKRKLTEFKNKITYERENWNELFPIEEHPKWADIEKKLNYYKERVDLLNAELNNCVLK